MQEQTQNKSWVSALFIIVGILAFGYFVHLLITAPTNPTRSRRTPENQSDTASKPVDIVLIKNHPQLIDDVTIVFRGVQEDAVLFELIIMELDPQYVYKSRISIRNAKRGFVLMDKLFRLTFVSGEIAHLKIDRNS